MIHTSYLLSLGDHTNSSTPVGIFARTCAMTLDEAKRTFREMLIDNLNEYYEREFVGDETGHNYLVVGFDPERIVDEATYEEEPCGLGDDDGWVEPCPYKGPTLLPDPDVLDEEVVFG